MRSFNLFSLRSALTLSAIALSVTLLFPLSGDNALYMYMADLLVQGRAPYLGSWDVNFPGIVFLHLVHVLPFGGSEIASHLFDIVVQLIGCYVIYRLTDDLSGSEHASWLASVLFAVYYVSGGLALCGERDCYIAILLAASILLLRTSRSNKSIVWAGFLSGAMLLLRPTAGIFGLTFILWLLIEEKEQRVAKAGLFIAAGAVFPILFTLVYLVIGGFDDFIQATYTYNVEVYARLEFAFDDIRRLRPFGYFLLGSIVGIWSIYRESKRGAIVISVMILAATLYLIPVYKFWYHFHPLMILLVIVSSIGWVEAITRIVQWMRGPLLVTALLTVAVLLAFSFKSIYRTDIPSVVASFTQTGELKETYREFYGSEKWGQYVQDSIAQYLLEHNARIVQSLTTPMYPMLKAGVVPASRFTSIYNLCWRSPKVDGLLPMQIEWRDEFLTDLDRTLPDYIISSEELPDHVFNNGYLPLNVLADFPRLQELLNEQYFPETVIGGYTLHRRRM